MPGKMTLNLDHSVGKAGTHQTLRVEGAGVEDFLGGARLQYLVEGQRFGPPALLDGAMFGVILIAMQLAAPLRIKGAVSGEAVRNAYAFQEAWACMVPQRFQMVEIEPDRVIETRKPLRGRAVSAFSGGLDGSFTAVRHARKLVGNGSYNLTHAVMIQGFDVHLGNRTDFESLRRRVAPLLAELEIELISVQTNMKTPDLRRPRFHPQPYMFSQAAQIACILHAISGPFDQGLIGSTEPYSGLCMPWASNPATDYLLSGAGLQIVHDGAGYARVEKAELLARYPTALKTLRVCWDGKQQDRNCGVCEKCVRTRLNFLAVGVADPPCFDQPLDETMVASISTLSPTVLGEAKATADYAEKAGISASWLTRLKARVEELERAEREGDAPPWGRYAAQPVSRTLMASR